MTRTPYEMHPSPDSADKKPYHPPAIEESFEFETLTLACTAADIECSITGQQTSG